MSRDALEVLRQSNQSIRRVALDNGLTLLLKPDASAPLVAIQYWVRAGAIHEAEHLGGGLSHYLEHMVFKGTPSRAPGVISTTIADAGGEINAYTSNDRTVFHVVMPAEKAQLGLEVLTDAVFHPSFPAEEWEREREVVFREWAMGEDDPDRVSSRLAFDTAYQTHPYRVPIIGWRDILRKMGRDELTAYHQKLYSPDRMILSIAGDFDPAEMERAVRREMTSIPRTSREPVYIPQEPAQTQERFRRQEGRYGITRISWCFHTVSLDHPDTPALDVLSSVTGNGRSSLLVKRWVEENSLLSDAGAWSYTPEDPGLFCIFAECAPDREAEAIAALRSEVARWRTEPFDAEQIARARQEVLVGAIRQLTTVEGQASSMASGEFYAGNPRRIEVYLEHVARVTPEDLSRVAQAYLRTENGSWVVLAPAPEGDGAGEGNATAIPAGTEEPDVTLHTLSNGVRVLLMDHSRLPLVTFAASIGGGQLAEPAGGAGTSQLVSDLLTRGTSRHSAAELAEWLEPLGISMAGFSGRNTYGLSVSGLSPQTPVMLEVFAECLLDSQFPADELEKQRERQRAALRQEDESPMARASQLMRDVYFPGHPYQPSLNGTEESLTALSCEDLVAFHRRLLTPTNLVVAAFGDGCNEALLPQLEATFGRLPASAASPQWPPLPPPPPNGGRVEQTVPFNQTVLIRAWPGLAVLDPRDDAVAVLLDALSGLSSDLFKEVRDKRGLAYYTGATQFTGPVGGQLIAYAGTTEAAFPEVERQIEFQVQRLATEGPRADEFDRAVAQMKVDAARARQDLASLARQCTVDELLGLGYRYPLDAATRLDSLKMEAVRKAAQELMGSPPSVTIVLKDGAEETVANEADASAADVEQDD